MNSEELIEYFKKVQSVVVEFEDTCRMERESLQSTNYLYLTFGLSDYTNYIEVRISVEYANHVYMFCAHCFRAMEYL